LLGHPDNYIKANPLITPPHIVPEWYFLPFYAILRSVPNKLGGIVCMGCAIAVLGLLPLLGKSLILNPRFNPLYKAITFFFIFNIILLGWLGGMPAGVPFVLISQICTLFYFSYFFILLPLLNVLEKKILICAA
jgi:quinol-cytochrome oxidoreductase complex cytochrome b subunit